MAAPVCGRWVGVNRICGKPVTHTRTFRDNTLAYYCAKHADHTCQPLPERSER